MEGNWISTSSSRGQLMAAFAGCQTFFNTYVDLCDDIMNTLEGIAKKVKVCKTGTAKAVIDDINACMTEFSDKITNVPNADKYVTALSSYRKFKADMRKPEVAESANALVRACQPGSELSNRTKAITERVRKLCETADKMDNGNETDEERRDAIFIFLRAVNFTSRKISWVTEVVNVLGRA